ncbi:MAG: VWA domain-containing protein [Candidatus Firestonebacteria bacterium]|nr:VWA domain-containing protein [Candidatus Firestonebacteria bacterium]
MMKNKKVLAMILLAGSVAALSLSGCFKNPTDPFGSGGSGSGSAGITKNTGDTQTTAISAAASQVNHHGVYLSVLNQAGNPIPASYFQGANFQINYNGTTVKSGSITLSTASGSGQAISTSLVLDYSGSMSGDITSLETAASSFVNNMQAADRGEIIKFDDSIVEEKAFTADKTALLAGIHSTDYFGGSTALYDAIYMGVTHTAHETGQRAVVAFTDGGENASTFITSQAALITAAKSNGVPIFTIGLGSADTTSLQDISSQTGGFFYNAPTAADLTTIYQKIAQAFTNTVILSWPGFTYQSGALLVIQVTYICATGTYTSTINVTLP